MAITRPYYGIYRPFIVEKEVEEYHYILDAEFFASKNQHVMAYYLMTEDLKKVMEFIEPTNRNLTVHSHRLFELLLRACTEIESLFKELLKKHDYNKSDGLDMSDYTKLNEHLKLSEYTASFLDLADLHPYSAWNNNQIKRLGWYAAYNSVKHNRNHNFESANLQNVLLAISGLYILLSSLFYVFSDTFYNIGMLTYNVKGGGIYISNPPYYKLFTIKKTPIWTETEKYNFEWSAIKNRIDRFQKIIW